MSNFFIVKGPSGPVHNTQTLTETQKAQISSYAVTVLGYGTGTGVANAQTLTETQQAQLTYAVTSLSYS